MKNPTEGSSFCVGRGGMWLCAYSVGAFQEELNARFLWELAVKRFWYLKESYHEVFKNIWQ